MFVHGCGLSITTFSVADFWTEKKVLFSASWNAIGTDFWLMQRFTSTKNVVVVNLKN